MSWKILFLHTFPSTLVGAVRYLSSCRMIMKSLNPTKILTTNLSFVTKCMCSSRRGIHLTKKVPVQKNEAKQTFITFNHNIFIYYEESPGSLLSFFVVLFLRCLDLCSTHECRTTICCCSIVEWQHLRLWWKWRTQCTSFLWSLQPKT